jgi:hypothetical protein
MRKYYDIILAWFQKVFGRTSGNPGDVDSDSRKVDLPVDEAAIRRATRRHMKFTLGSSMITMLNEAQPNAMRTLLKQVSKQTGMSHKKIRKEMKRARREALIKARAESRGSGDLAGDTQEAVCTAETLPTEAQFHDQGAAQSGV